MTNSLQILSKFGSLPPFMMCLHNAGISASAQNIQDILGSGDEELPYGATPTCQMRLTFSMLSKYLNGIFFRNRIDISNQR